MTEPDAPLPFLDDPDATRHELERLARVQLEAGHITLAARLAQAAATHGCHAELIEVRMRLDEIGARAVDELIEARVRMEEISGLLNSGFGMLEDALEKAKSNG